MLRDTLFISHANPEDNQFCLWLAMRLVAEGYKVWCDLTNLVGGEDFWTDIEMVIRDNSAKVLYVTSVSSNHKQGPNKELALATSVSRSHGIRDFVLPLLIDDLPFGELNIHLNNINCISFNGNWARGLAQLLDKLALDDVPKSDAANPHSVATWWSHHLAGHYGVTSEAETLVSNHFSVEHVPQVVHLYAFNGCPFLPFPSLPSSGYTVTFASPEDLTAPWTEHISETLENFLNGATPIHRSQANRILSHLLRSAWEAEMRKRGLSQYMLANNASCFYFRKGYLPQDKIHFSGLAGKTYRQMVGFSTKGPATSPRKEYWHFGIEAKVLTIPDIRYSIRPHVVFSDEGENVWSDKARLHRARRSACKDWWNADWRDRILASMQWLAGPDKSRITLPVAGNESVVVSAEPVKFEHPISYAEPQGHDPLTYQLGDDFDLDAEEAEQV